MFTIYNTRTKQIEPFTPITDNVVSMYSCGPTVYDYVHVGNLRTFLLGDVLKRTLTLNGYEINDVMNITDVGHLVNDEQGDGRDKIEEGSQREGKTAQEIARFYTDAFKKDLKLLNIKEPKQWAVATDHIQEQVDQVKQLIDNGFTYQTDDGIYYDTTKNNAYGELINLKEQKLQSGKRVDLGQKQHLHDFALWKFSKKDDHRQMEWETPLGAPDGKTRPGFPGWHIECSAMAMKYLGDHFDMHLGGIDLSRVHHINEIAQAESITGTQPWVNTWVHGEFLLMKDAKMSKSEGNNVTLQAIIDKDIDPLVFRFYLLQGHYRKQLQFTWEALKAAQEGLKRIKRRAGELPEHGDNDDFRKQFLQKINADLNMPEALSLTIDHIKTKDISKEDITYADQVLGLNLLIHNEAVSAEVMDLVKKRQEARVQKDWELSDTLRNEINTLGYDVHDTDDGQKVEKQ